VNRCTKHNRSTGIAKINSRVVAYSFFSFTVVKASYSARVSYTSLTSSPTSHLFDSNILTTSAALGRREDIDKSNNDITIVAMFVSSKKMAADAAATRRERNEAHDKMSLS
jgi:hypothetical protein